MNVKRLVWLTLGVVALLSSASPAMAQERDPSEIVYVCYWSGEGWRVASQFRSTADAAVGYGQAVYPDEFGSCPWSPPWDLGMDSTPMAGYCSWHTGVGNPSQGWFLGIGAAAIVAEDVAASMADSLYGTYVWLEWDGTCPDYPAASWWYGAWADEVGGVHYPE